MEKTTIDVVAALIIRGGKVFCAQRPDKGETAKKWEFPGGKIEKGETPAQALERELQEELGVRAQTGSFVASVQHQYTAFFLRLQLFTADIGNEKITLREHLDSRWLTADELHTVDWAPADLPLLPKIAALL